MTTEVASSAPAPETPEYVLDSPLGAGVVTCLSSSKKKKKGAATVSSLVSPCFGALSGSKSSGRVSHRHLEYPASEGATTARPHSDRAGAAPAPKHHRLLQQQYIRKKLSTTRGDKSGRAQGQTQREQDTLRSEVDQEIKLLERDLVDELYANIERAASSLEAMAHGTLTFLSPEMADLKSDLLSDHTLRRFLVARGWDVDLATQMLMEYLRWREVNPVGCIKNESITTSLAAKKVYMLKEKDWQGRPVLVVIATRHMVEHQSLEETIRFVQYCTDKIMHIAMDDEAGISKMCVFVDLRNVGGHCLDKTALGTMLELMQNYFPERLGTAILWKPPTIFWLAWKLIHNFIPKETRRRMCFAYKQKDVSKFMDPAFVPEIFGGTASDDILTPIEDA